jgi:cathepsin L
MRLTACALSLLLLCDAIDALSFPRWWPVRQEHVSTATHATLAYTVDDYLRDFGRQYTPEEAAWRVPLLSQRLASIAAHNTDPGQHAYQQGVNHLTDRSDEELGRLRGLRLSDERSTQQQFSASVTMTPAERAAVEVDWRAAGILTPVKDQMGCGSCWAFAAIEAIEAQYALQSGRLEELSEQQILECTPNPLECGGDGGCSGGTPQLAWQAAMDLWANGSIVSEWSYPYESAHGDVGKCRLNAARMPPVARVTGYVTLPSNSMDAVLEALKTVGPLAVSVDASKWFLYSSGIFTGCQNDESPVLDHAVLLVGAGFDEEAQLPYWLIRNSWGPSWGEKGYIRLLRQLEPTCAEDVRPWEGDACRNVTSPVKEITVCGSCGILYDVTYPIVEAADGVSPRRHNA